MTHFWCLIWIQIIPKAFNSATDAPIAAKITVWLSGISSGKHEELEIGENVRLFLSLVFAKVAKI